MAEVPSKSLPPVLNVKKAKDYSVADYDTPCIVIEDTSCENVLPLVKDGILGINREGILSILNGAVPPTQSWVRYVYRQQEQPVNYATMYPKQAWLLAEISDMLLRHALTTRIKSAFKSTPNIDYPKIKAGLMSQFGLKEADHFSDSLSLPTIRLMTPSFMTDPIVKYVWAVKVWQGKLNLKEEAFETMLEALDAEETAKEGEPVQYVTEVYDYSMFKTGVAACAAGPAMDAAGSGATAATAAITEQPTRTPKQLKPVLREKLEKVVRSFEGKASGSTEYTAAMSAAQKSILNLMGDRQITEGLRRVVGEQLGVLAAGNKKDKDYNSAVAAILKEVEKIDALAKTMREILEKAVEELARRLATSTGSEVVDIRKVLQKALGFVMDEVITQLSSIEEIPETGPNLLRNQIERILKSVTENLVKEAAKEAGYRLAMDPEQMRRLLEGILADVVRQLIPNAVEEVESTTLKEALESVVGNVASKLSAQEGEVPVRNDTILRNVLQRLVGTAAKMLQQQPEQQPVPQPPQPPQPPEPVDLTRIALAQLIQNAGQMGGDIPDIHVVQQDPNLQVCLANSASDQLVEAWNTVQGDIYNNEIVEANNNVANPTNIDVYNIFKALLIRFRCQNQETYNRLTAQQRFGGFNMNLQHIVYQINIQKNTFVGNVGRYTNNPQMAAQMAAQMATQIRKNLLLLRLLAHAIELYTQYAENNDANVLTSANQTFSLYQQLRLALNNNDRFAEIVRNNRNRNLIQQAPEAVVEQGQTPEQTYVQRIQTAHDKFVNILRIVRPGENVQSHINKLTAILRGNARLNQLLQELGEDEP